jgi:PAS domain S-box-containing protein
MDARWSGEAKYQALLAVAQAANSRRDLSSVIDAVCDALHELVSIDLLGVVTHERDTVRARAIHFCRAPRGPDESHDAYVVRFSESFGATGDSWKHTPFLRDAMERDRRTLVLEHVSTDPRLDGAGMKRAGVECAVLVPLTMGDEFVGAMVVARTSPSPFPPDEVAILEDVARPVTSAVANALAFEAIQRAARQAEARARLLDLTHDAVVAFDMDRRITYWNRGAESLYGWSAAEVMGRPAADLLQASFPGPSDEVIASALMQTGVWQGEATHTTREGRHVVVDGRIVLERNESGKPVGVLATTNDVTDRKADEEKLRKAQEALAHATRLTTLGEVSASIAHEINQPLTAIVNNATASLVLLSDRPPNLDEVRAALKDVVNDAERASAIIERVRQMSRRSAPQQAPCHIQEIVSDVAALAARMSVLRGVAIHTEIPRNLPPVIGDFVQLEQVLLNLVVNAMDAMSEVEPVERRVEIRAVVDTEDGHPSVTIRVADRGVGLKREDTPRLFEAFYTTKPHGVGLGLAISRSIVEAHGGRLWAEPNPEKGAVFAFRLPAGRAAAAA